jgi:predicted Mrr-cat superfamily restriction endonuclease
VSTRKCWVVRPYPNGQYRMKEFLDESVVAIGWPDIGDLESMTDQEIRDSIQRGKSGDSERSISLQSGMVIRFSKEIAKGDVVFVPDGEDIHLAEVESAYEFNAAKINAGYPHQCKVRWLSRIPRKKLEGNLLGAMRPRLAVYSLNKYSQEIEMLLRNHLGGSETEGSTPEPYTEDNDSSAGREAHDISVLVKDAITIIKQSMRSEDPELRLAAAGIVIQSFGSTLQR